MIDIIEKTRDKIALTQHDVERLVSGIVDGAWPDYQVVAWLMAAYLQGLRDKEVFWLTDVVARSGSQTADPLGLADKHSTGGVGDKTTLIVAPLVASLGVPTAKMSGRGLGHTGGTLDKLESIPGFRVTLSRADITRQVERVGLAVVAQSGELAPADKKLYALRDVTATVDSIPLIAVSIMSKKLAGGSPNIVLDVKVGNGAFMQSLDRARELAQLMVRIGVYHGRNVRALLTGMDCPLGFAVGNAIEINEALNCLRGKGPKDLREEVIALASHMVSMTRGIAAEDAMSQVTHALDGGLGWRKFEEWIQAQGGDVSSVQQDLPLAPYRKDWIADRTLTVQRIDTHAVGRVALELGAGRQRLQDPVDHEVGLLCYAKPGKTFNAGEPIATVYARTEADATAGIRGLQRAVEFGGVASSADHQVVIEVIGA